MFSVIDEQLDLASLHYKYIHPTQLEALSELEPESFDVVVLFASNLGVDIQVPFRYDATLHEDLFSKLSSVLKHITRVTSKTGTLYIYGSPALLPFLAVDLDHAGWQFKYWLALETFHPLPSQTPVIHTHEGILLYVRNKKQFSLRKVRSAHTMCDVCGDFTADWGGKKHLRNPLGYAISDVWDDLPAVTDEKHILSKEVWERLILLTAKDKSRILCVGYDGGKDLDNFISG